MTGPAAKAVGLAASNGAITGTVRGLDPGGGASAYVVAWPADSRYADDAEPVDTPHTIVRAMVLPDGSYRLEGLSPGPYYVSATAKEYETRPLRCVPHGLDPGRHLLPHGVCQRCLHRLRPP